MIWDVRKQLRDRVRSFIRFYKTYDAGCCQHQGAEHRGYRAVLWNTYVIECGQWGTRELCRICGKLVLMEKMWDEMAASSISRRRPVAPANKKEKQGVPPPMKH